MNDSTGMPEGADCWQQIAEAHRTYSWTKLGYRSWAGYMAGEWDLAEMTRLSPREQAKIAAFLFAAELPIKDVATALGVPYDVLGRARRMQPRPGDQRPEKGSQVYLIGSDDFRPVKIGKGDAERRLAELQCGNPFELTIRWSTPGGVALEAALHHKFDPWRTRGEWFDFPAGMDPVRFVSQMARALVPLVGTTV